MKDVDAWASNEFGGADLGDIRRTRRLVVMAGGAAQRPSGKVADVFAHTPEREGAYDFLESAHFDHSAIAGAVFAATVRRARSESVGHVFVLLDGTTLALTDERGSKGFGRIGSPNRPTRGLCVLSALAVAHDGVPLGLLAQHFWTRREPEKMSRAETTRRNKELPFEDKEPFHFVAAAREARELLAESNLPPWFVIDREGDNRDILTALLGEPSRFTIRARGKRRAKIDDAAAIHVREKLAKLPSLYQDEVEIRRNGGRPARKASVEVRASAASIAIQHQAPARTEWIDLYAVLVQETLSSAGKNERLEWVLYTNVPVASADDARLIVESYRLRWRIEEFHRTWKSGACDVEDAQLRSFEAMTKWATILAAVATRIERLKYLSRSAPSRLAVSELHPLEIEVLKLDRKRRGDSADTLKGDPSIATATRWVAELGGWMGLKSSGPPGSITLGRGLERLAHYVEAISLMRDGAATTEAAST